MSNVGKIKIKTFAELQATTGINVEPEPPPTTEDRTPEKKRAGKTRAATTTKKVQAKSEPNGGVIVASTAIKRSNKKTPLPGQLRIDSFFKSAAKSYKVNMVPVPRSSAKAMDAPAAKRKGTSRGRKRLFDESTTTSTTSTDTLDRKPPEKRVQPGRRAKGKEKTNLPEEPDVIDLCSEDEGDKTIKAEPPAEAYSSPVRNSIPAATQASISKRPSSPAVVKTSPGTKRLSTKTSPGNKRSSVKTSPDPPMAAIPENSSLPKNSKKGAGRKQKTPKPCPPYKVVEGTSFCVDGFQFGDIDGVSHYFLSHYHADHYIGLTKNFCYPLYMSPTTARLVRTFIKVDEMCINEIEVDQTLMVDGVQVTALEANHCPGALLFFFQLPSGKNILHTGDFRACAEMESLPIFWNHPNIDLLYLDTTYMNKNYDFCHQTESVDRAIELVRAFNEKNLAKRILFVCGSYVIGKEKIWLALAKEFTLRSLVEYLSQFEDQYDMLLGIRPSGWEKNSKPSYGKRISTIGIEYSEHSSYKELERFVRFLKPKRVLSTVPVGRDLFVTGDVPTEWYKYEGRASMLSTGYQPSISSFLATPKRIVPKMTAATAMSVSPGDEKASNGKGDGGEDDWQTAVPADHITILSSTSEKKSRQESEIVVKNEPLGPDTCPETEIINRNETLEPEMSYDIDIVIKNESLPSDSCPVTEPYATPTEAEESKDNPGISKDSCGPCTIVIPDSQEQNKDDGSPCGSVLVSRLTSDATDDWLL
ncbi:hypothetical protein M5D96_000166 [Drosophila gunungcola]|uniref:Metallo-beta-lactamase domain-containing protein n=1 Tax=Drosophila gunungcola TaxID=103775 RepID=A0A9P9YWE4_9MUSC|nr:hypothetical protein M5D96_000166 [Drosophila gunungcola]